MVVGWGYAVRPHKGIEYEVAFNPHIGSGGGDTAPLNGLGLCPT